MSALTTILTFGVSVLISFIIGLAIGLSVGYSDGCKETKYIQGDKDGHT